MKNIFFHLALKEAAKRVGKPARLVRLTVQVVSNLGRMDRKKLSIGAFRERITIMGRMVSAYARGQYRNLPLKAMLSLVAALIYFVNPLDLVPDTFVGIGLADDFAVITWVYNSFTKELAAFHAWENSRSVAQVLA